MPDNKKHIVQIWDIFLGKLTDILYIFLRNNEVMKTFLREWELKGNCFIRFKYYEGDHARKFLDPH